MRLARRQIGVAPAVRSVTRCTGEAIAARRAMGMSGQTPA